MSELSGLVCTHCGEEEMFFQLDGKDHCGSCAQPVEPSSANTTATHDVDSHEDEDAEGPESKDDEDITEDEADAVPSLPSEDHREATVDTPDLGDTQIIPVASIIRKAKDEEWNPQPPPVQESPEEWAPQPPAEEAEDWTPNPPAQEEPSSSPTPTAEPTEEVVEEQKEQVAGKYMTDEDIEALRKAVTEEVLTQTNAEMEIVTIEHEEELSTLREDMAKLKRKCNDYALAETTWLESKKGLEDTLNEVLETLKSKVDENSDLQAHYDADMDLKETEIKKLQTDLNACEKERNELRSEIAAVKGELENIKTSDGDKEEKIKTLEADLENAGQFVEELRKRAETKLKNAHGQFTKVQKENSQQAKLIHKLEAELTAATESVETLREQVQGLTGTLNDTKVQLEEAEANLHAAETQKADLASTSSQLQKKMGEIHAHNQTLSRQNAIYKDQLATTNKQLRQMQEDAGLLLQTAATNEELTKRIEKLEKDNSDLKGRLFDAMERESKFKAQVSDMSKAGSDAAAIKAIERLEKDNSILQATVEAKELENKELLGVCNELMEQLELAKG